MAKRSKNQARRSGRSGTPGWKWLLAGLAIGGLAFGYLHFRDRWNQPDSKLPQPDAQAHAPLPDGDDAVAEATERPKMKYEFFDLLPEKEVVIPDAELDAAARAEAARPRAPANAEQPTTAVAGAEPAAGNAATSVPTAASTGSDAPRYLIQAGAFRGSAEAEALKAQIALTGEIARVEVAQINGNTVHRVRMGPYPNASALAAAKQALASHGIAAQAIRVK